MNSITSGGLHFPPMLNGFLPGSPAMTFGTMTITVSNAVAMIGRIFLDGRPASKILSSAGGAISFRTGGTSIWTALSHLGIGIQDVDTTAGPPARPDLVFDVSTTITSSTVTLTTNHWHRFTMTSGAKTLSHGQMYAFVVRMGTRVSTDAASVGGISGVNSAILPLAATLSAGAAWGPTALSVPVLFECDDGTLGWFHNGLTISSISSQSISSGGANTEYGMRFVLPWNCEIDGVGVNVGPNTSAADFSVILYSDPNGTPVTVTAIPMQGDGQMNANIVSAYPIPLSDVVSITASTTYMLAVRANTATPITMRKLQYAAAAHKIAMPGGSGLACGARGGGAGAFSMVETNIPAGFYVRVNSISPTTTTVTTTTTTTITVGGGAGGMLVHPGMTGGIRG